MVRQPLVAVFDGLGSQTQLRGNEKPSTSFLLTVNFKLDDDMKYNFPKHFYWATISQLSRKSNVCITSRAIQAPVETRMTSIIKQPTPIFITSDLCKKYLHELDMHLFNMFLPHRFTKMIIKSLFIQIISTNNPNFFQPSNKPNMTRQKIIRRKRRS